MSKHTQCILDEKTVVSYTCDRCGRPSGEGNILSTCDPLPDIDTLTGVERRPRRRPRVPISLSLMTRSYKTHELVQCQLCRECEDSFHSWYQAPVRGVVDFIVRRTWETGVTDRERYLGRCGIAVNILHNKEKNRYEIWNDPDDVDVISIHIPKPMSPVEEVCLAWQATYDLCVKFCEDMLWYVINKPNEE